MHHPSILHTIYHYYSMKSNNKTNEQKAKEAKVLKEVEGKLAEIRLSTLGATGGRGNKKGVPNSAEGLNSGEARDIVAKIINWGTGVINHPTPYPLLLFLHIIWMLDI